MRISAAWLGLGLAAAIAGPASAHHGWSGYDASQLVTLAGKVQSIDYASPHVTLTLDADGKLWEIVLAPPSRMTRRGLADGSIEVGAAVTVEGYPHRTEATEFRAERIELAGTAYELR